MSNQEYLNQFKGSSNSIAVVGSHGFIGQSISRIFRDAGCHLIEFNRSNPIFEASGRLNHEILNVKTVIWAATSIYPSSSLTNEDIAQNEIENWKIFLSKFQAETKTLGRIIYLSSAGCTYSSENENYVETDPAEGTNKYGRIKLEMESLLNSYISNSVIVRLSNVYGRNQPTGRGLGVIAEWASALRYNKPISVFGDLDSYRDYIYIDDAVRALIALAAENECSGIFNVGSGVSTSLREVIYFFELLSNSKLELNVSGRRPTDRLGYSLNIDKIKSHVDWFPTTPLQKGLANVIQGQE